MALGYGHGPARRQVLSGFTHDFAPGRVTAITGRSGVGKTTLLKLVAGLDRPSSGQVMVDGYSLGDCDAEHLASLRRELIGYLSQEPAPIGFLSTQENAVLILRIRGWEAGAATERAAEALTRAGLADRIGQRVHRLSAGEAQRLALARALASARGLLIVDEPTSRQDESNARLVGALLAAAAHEEGQTVICATHDPAVIREADTVVRLAGQLGLDCFVTYGSHPRDRTLACSFDARMAESVRAHRDTTAVGSVPPRDSPQAAHLRPGCSRRCSPCSGH